MDKHYIGNIASAGQSIGYAAPPPPANSVEIVTRQLIQMLHDLSSEVLGVSGRIHGPSPLAGLTGSSGSAPAVQGWADEIRDNAGSACSRAADALKELSRIRETLGL